MEICDPKAEDKNLSIERPKFKDRDDCRKRLRAAMITIYYNLTGAEIDVIISRSEGVLSADGFDKYIAHVNEACRIEFLLRAAG